MFFFATQKNGIVAEEDYPYKSQKDKCRKELLADAGKLHYPISGTKSLPKNEKSLKSGLAEKGPLMVIIDGTNLAFYSKGIIKGSFCDHGEVNHAVSHKIIIDQGVKAHNKFFALKFEGGRATQKNKFYFFRPICRR